MSTYVALKRLLLSLIGYSLYHFLVALKRLLLFCYFIGYFTVQLQKQGWCDLGLIAFLLLRLMYGKLNHYVIIMKTIPPWSVKLIS